MMSKNMINFINNNFLGFKEFNKEVKMFEIKKVDVMSFAKVSAIINGFFGLIIGVMFTLISLIIFAIGKNPGMGLSSAIGFLSILTFPVVFGITGFVIAGLVGRIYNSTSKRFKGIKIEIGEIDEEELMEQQKLIETQNPEQQEITQEKLELKGNTDPNNPPKPSD